MGYVDKDFLIHSLERKREYILEHFPDEIASFDSALEFVRAVPTVETVKRGKWTLNKDGSGTCSECGRKQNSCWDLDGWDNFCHFCGADMR